MTPELVIQLARRSFEATLLLSAPLLIFSLVVGLLISIFQAVTSINEATLAFAPKIIAVMIAMIIFFPWMMTYMSDFTREEQPGAEKARTALIARLAQLDRKPFRVRPPQSLQPTPEAAKTRVTRLRKKRLLLKRSQRPRSAA